MGDRIGLTGSGAAASETQAGALQARDLRGGGKIGGVRREGDGREE